jgi:hypothetical protein
MGSVSEGTELVSERSPERSYAGPARKMLALCALAVALLPIPVTLLELLPTYRTQGRFLSFYAPTICLLLLGYLFYIRDSLARLMFADLAEPLPERDPYYREPFRLSMRRLLVQVRQWFLIVLPVVLVGISFYCVTAYAARFAESVEIVSNLSRQQPNGEGIGAGNQTGTGVERSPGSEVTSRPPAPRSPALDQSPFALARLRRHALETTGIDDVPFFAELTVLYIGVFVAALMALIVMGLKEYAMDAMGVTEEDLVLGREPADGE